MAEQRGGPRAKGKREKEMERQSRVSSDTKGSGSEKKQRWHTGVLSFQTSENSSAVKVKVPAAALGVLGCREPPQDQRLGFCLALWLLSNVRRITASCRALGHKHADVHGTKLQ